RKKLDKKSEETSLNFTCLATPAEGLSGRFVRIDKKRFGTIKGVTDREYYTNSFHIPVYYPINAFDKIKLEAPYHALTNAGHISYIELDGDPTENLEAFEQVVRCMKEAGIGYGSINHPVDRDPVCGYTGIIGDYCPKCGRKIVKNGMQVERIRRITGYLVGTLDRFNNAKKAEVKDRVKHSLDTADSCGCDLEAI
ncbi:MAG: anaerobic ribonucleoside triphosphate reductase, partial [Ruminococcus sp.]|nr:anaerobic ribonucleoside triphosphate reductase [Ruminococcus sp.]